MPLVIPNQNPNGSSKTEEWQNKLVGKTLNETTSNETVRLLVKWMGTVLIG